MTTFPKDKSDPQNARYLQFTPLTGNWNFETTNKKEKKKKKYFSHSKLRSLIFFLRSATYIAFTQYVYCFKLVSPLKRT